MRTRLLYATRILFALLPIRSYAQGTCVSGCLIETQSQAPLRFAAVQLQRDSAGAVADEYGYFEVESTEACNGDSLFVFTDQVRTAYWVTPGNSRGMQLAVLTPAKAPLPLLATHRRHTKFGVALPRQATWGLPGTAYAFFVQNNAPVRRGTLRTASFYIGDGCFPREVFRVHFYRMAGNSPGVELLPAEVLLWAPRHNAWFTIDLTPYHLAIPEEGYFVALEYIADEGFRQAYTASILFDYTPTGPFMQPVYEARTGNVWSYIIGTGWTQLPLTNGVVGRYGAMIKLEVDPVE